jgi:hypothetical protein
LPDSQVNGCIVTNNRCQSINCSLHTVAIMLLSLGILQDCSKFCPTSHTHPRPRTPPFPIGAQKVIHCICVNFFRFCRFHQPVKTIPFDVKGAVGFFTGNLQLKESSCPHQSQISPQNSLSRRTCSQTACWRGLSPEVGLCWTAIHLFERHFYILRLQQT